MPLPDVQLPTPHGEGENLPLGRQFHGSQYCICQFLRSEKHVSVYSVCDDDSGAAPIQGLEARVYVLGEVDAKVRKHRLRCIKRLAGRSVAEVRHNNVCIIITRVDVPSSAKPAADEDEVDAMPATAQLGVGSESTGEAAARPLQRTSQQESARVKQQQRRQRARLERRRRAAGEISGAEEDDEIGSDFSRVGFECDGEGVDLGTRPTISQVFREALLVKQVPPESTSLRILESPDFDTTRFYGLVKRSEAKWRRRQEERLRKLCEHIEKGSRAQQQKIMNTAWGSGKSDELQRRLAVSRDWVPIIKQMQSILLNAADNADKMYRDLREEEDSVVEKEPKRAAGIEVILLSIIRGEGYADLLWWESFEPRRDVEGPKETS